MPEHDSNAVDDEDDLLDDEDGLERDGPSPALLKVLRRRGLKVKSSRGGNRRTKKSSKKSSQNNASASNTRRKSSKKKSSKTKGAGSSRKNAIRAGYKKRHIRFPMKYDDMLVEMKEEDETTFTDVVITAINNEYVRRQRRRIRREKRERDAKSEGSS